MTDVINAFKALYKTDGYENILTGYGTIEDRKKQYSLVRSRRATAIERNIYYKDHPILSNIIDFLVDDSTKKDVIIDHEKGSLFLDKFNDLNLIDWMARTWKMARKDGTAVLVLNVVDGQPTETPVNVDRIKDVKINFILSKDDLRPLSADLDNPSLVPLSYWRLGTIPEFYQINHNEINKVYHKSRLLIFNGKYAGEDELKDNNSFYESYIDAYKEAVLFYEIVVGSLTSVSDSMIQEVIKFNGLTDKAVNDLDDEVIKTMLLTAMSKSITKKLILDKDDDFEYHSANLSGYSQLENIAKNYLAACVGYPKIKIFGDSPAGGIGSETGSYEDDLWSNIVYTAQSKEFKPNLLKIISYLKPIFKIKRTELIPLDFEPLNPMSLLEQAEIRNKQADTDIKYLKEGVLISEEIRQSRFSNKFNINTQLSSKKIKNTPKIV
jgi:phage-related protein (TIGR01555 family)